VISKNGNTVRTQVTRPDRFPDFLEEWNRNAGDSFSLTFYLGTSEGLLYVVAAQWLYAPDFIEYRGGVFRADLPRGLSERKRASIDEWIDEPGGSVSKAEYHSNWLLLWDMFAACDLEKFDEDIIQLGRTIKCVWDALLKAKYPNRNFRVEYSDDNEDHGPQVTFYSVSD
jgi:hypothetical protein